MDLHYTSYGTEGQLLPLGLETPIAGAAHFRTELGVYPEPVCCKQLSELP